MTLNEEDIKKIKDKDEAGSVGNNSIVMALLIVREPLNDGFA